MILIYLMMNKAWPYSYSLTGFGPARPSTSAGLVSPDLVQ